MRLPKKTKCKLCNLELTNYNYTSHFKKHNLTTKQYFQTYGKFWYLTDNKKYITIKQKKISKMSIRSGITSLHQNEYFTFDNLKFMILVKSYHNSIKSREYKDFVSNTIFPELSYKEKFKQYKKILEYKKDKSETIEYLSIRYGKQKALKMMQTKSNRYKGSTNPAYQHNGKFSPFSKKFIKYKDKPPTEIENIINQYNQNRSILFKNEPERLPINKEYWLKLGYSEEKAKKLQIGRQCTFSLKKCIKKYGEEKGKQRWLDRQEKWHNSYKKSSFSKISQELFWSIIEHLPSLQNIYFAQLDTNKKLDVSGKNNELKLRLSTVILPDFINTKNKKIIEFDGTYWHKNDSKDKIRDAILLQHGYSILHIKEAEYKKNKITTIKQCVNYLTT